MAASRWRAIWSWASTSVLEQPAGWGRAIELELIPLFVFFFFYYIIPVSGFQLPRFCFFSPGMSCVLEALISVLFQCFGWFPVCPMCILSVFTCFQIGTRWWKIIYLLDCNFMRLMFAVSNPNEPMIYLFSFQDCLLRPKGAAVWFTVFLGQKNNCHSRSFTSAGRSKIRIWRQFFHVTQHSCQIIS